MGWFSDFVSDPIGTLGDTGQKVIDTVTDHPIETAAIAAAAYFGMPPITAESGATAFGVSEGTVTATELGTLGTESASTAGLSGIDLGGAGGSPASWTNATSANMTGSATGWTAGQIASTASSGLNLATSATKLSMLGKTMNASTPTADGLTGGLAASPIQTPSGLITATPQGPITAGPVAAPAGGFMGMDNQTLIVIAVSIAGIYYLMKHGK